jgi:hypothetical protein
VLVAVGSPASGSLTGSSSSIVTVGVGSLAEVEAVVQASESGTVSLVAAEPSDGVGPGPSDGVGPGASAGAGSGASASAPASGS